MNQNIIMGNNEDSRIASCPVETAETIMEEINKKLPMLKTVEALKAVHEMIELCLDNEKKRTQFS